jgi:hypothetical protein
MSALALGLSEALLGKAQACGKDSGREDGKYRGRRDHFRRCLTFA